MNDEQKSLGQVAYEAYDKNRPEHPLKEHHQPMPPWGTIGVDLQRAWQAAAEAVVGELL